MQDSVNAFIDVFTIPGATDGPLAGLSFGAKDLYDIAGHVTGCGSPDWARTHPPATRHAPAVQALLDAGATLLGKTHTDEIAYSLMGVNAHYGTPINTAAPDRVPGGSSSGSAAATAAGLVDIGLGSDTGGSVRMPASFCGVYGIRTTHGRIDLSDAMPFAPSFDTVGWFARDSATFAKAGAAFDIEVPDEVRGIRLMIADDAMALANTATRSALGAALEKLQGRFGVSDNVTLNAGNLAEWREVFRVCQAAEIWQTHGAWVEMTQPDFGPGIKERFQIAAAIKPQMHRAAQTAREKIRTHLTGMLVDNGVIILPASPGPAPFRDADEAALDSFRMAALELLCPAGLAGLPQISVPVGTVDGAPVGLSLIAAPGNDGLLLAIARDIFI